MTRWCRRGRVRGVSAYFVACCALGACVEVRSQPVGQDTGSSEIDRADIVDVGTIDADMLDADSSAHLDGGGAEVAVATDVFAATDVDATRDVSTTLMDHLDVDDVASDDPDTAVPADIGVLDADASTLSSDIVADIPDHALAQDSPDVSDDRGAPGTDIGPCTMGLTRCNGECVDAQTATIHCGACGMDCNAAFPGATGVCRSGRCAPAACLPGFGNCDLMIDNGCEVRTTDDRMNCGTCGRLCQIANATSVCSESLCRLASCNTGFADCDGVELNGCEVTLATSGSHCGRCGRSCPVQDFCIAGECVTALRSCAEIHRAMPARPSGTYLIDLDGLGTRPPMMVYCDMSTDEGGWTLVARVRGNSTAHGSTGAVGSLTSPTQSDPAKLSDDDINLLRRANPGGLAVSLVRFDCRAQRTFFQQDLAFSATSATNALMRCSASPTGPWSMGSYFHNHYGFNTYGASSCPQTLYRYTMYSGNGCTCGTDSSDGLRDGVMYVR